MEKRNLTDLGDASWLYHPNTQQIFKTFNKNGYEVKAVGGAIRNTILGGSIKDIDFATTASPETILDLAQKADLRVIPTGLQHGTVTVLVENTPFEVTTLRQDVETDGRRAKVAFTDNWLEDAKRRDFTMNAIYVNHQGILYDPLEGYKDLKENRIRFIGIPAERICEDYLRILRFFRFHAEYDLKNIDAPSLNACVQHRDGLRHLSSERIAAELLRLLSASHSYDVVKLMFRYGLLVELIGCVPRLNHLQKLLKICDRLKHHTDSTLYLAALAVHTKEDANRLANKLKLSNKVRHLLEQSANLIPSEFSPYPEKEEQQKLYHLGKEDYQNCILIRWTRSDRPIDDTNWKNLYISSKNWEIPTLPLKGADLIKLAIPKGPLVGEILKTLEQEWINSHFSISKDDLIEKVKSLKIKERAT